MWSNSWIPIRNLKQLLHPSQLLHLNQLRHPSQLRNPLRKPQRLLQNRHRQLQRNIPSTGFSHALPRHGTETASPMPWPHTSAGIIKALHSS